MFIGKGGVSIAKLERETASKIALREGKVLASVSRVPGLAPALSRRCPAPRRLREVWGGELLLVPVDPVGDPCPLCPLCPLSSSLVGELCQLSLVSLLSFLLLSLVPLALNFHTRQVLVSAEDRQVAEVAAAIVRKRVSDLTALALD